MDEILVSVTFKFIPWYKRDRRMKKILAKLGADKKGYIKVKKNITVREFLIKIIGVVRLYRNTLGYQRLILVAFYRGFFGLNGDLIAENLLLADVNGFKENPGAGKPNLIINIDLAKNVNVVYNILILIWNAATGQYTIFGVQIVEKAGTKVKKVKEDGLKKLTKENPQNSETKGLKANNFKFMVIDQKGLDRTIGTSNDTINFAFGKKCDESKPMPPVGEDHLLLVQKERASDVEKSVKPIMDSKQFKDVLTNSKEKVKSLLDDETNVGSLSKASDDQTKPPIDPSITGTPPNEDKPHKSAKNPNLWLTGKKASEKTEYPKILDKKPDKKDEVPYETYTDMPDGKCTVSMTDGWIQSYGGDCFFDLKGARDRREYPLVRGNDMHYDTLPHEKIDQTDATKVIVEDGWAYDESEKKYIKVDNSDPNKNKPSDKKDEELTNEQFKKLFDDVSTKVDGFDVEYHKILNTKAHHFEGFETGKLKNDNGKPVLKPGWEFGRNGKGEIDSLKAMPGWVQKNKNNNLQTKLTQVPKGHSLSLDDKIVLMKQYNYKDEKKHDVVLKPGFTEDETNGVFTVRLNGDYEEVDDNGTAVKKKFSKYYQKGANDKYILEDGKPVLKAGWQGTDLQAEPTLISEYEKVDENGTTRLKSGGSEPPEIEYKALIKFDANDQKFLVAFGKCFIKNEEGKFMADKEGHPSLKTGWKIGGGELVLMDGYEEVPHGSGNAVEISKGGGGEKPNSEFSPEDQALLKKFPNCFVKDSDGKYTKNENGKPNLILGYIMADGDVKLDTDSFTMDESGTPSPKAKYDKDTSPSKVAEIKDDWEPSGLKIGNKDFPGKLFHYMKSNNYLFKEFNTKVIQNDRVTQKSFDNYTKNMIVVIEDSVKFNKSAFESKPLGILCVMTDGNNNKTDLEKEKALSEFDTVSEYLKFNNSNEEKTFDEWLAEANKKGGGGKTGDKKKNITYMTKDQFKIKYKKNKIFQFMDSPSNGSIFLKEGDNFGIFDNGEPALKEGWKVNGDDIVPDEGWEVDVSAPGTVKKVVGGGKTGGDKDKNKGKYKTFTEKPSEDRLFSEENKEFVEKFRDYFMRENADFVRVDGKIVLKPGWKLMEGDKNLKDMYMIIMDGWETDSHGKNEYDLRKIVGSKPMSEKDLELVSKFPDYCMRDGTTAKKPININGKAVWKYGFEVVGDEVKLKNGWEYNKDTKSTKLKDGYKDVDGKAQPILFLFKNGDPNAEEFEEGVSKVNGSSYELKPGFYLDEEDSALKKFKPWQYVRTDEKGKKTLVQRIEFTGSGENSKLKKGYKFSSNGYDIEQIPGVRVVDGNPVPIKGYKWAENDKNEVIPDFEYGLKNPPKGYEVINPYPKEDEPLNEKNYRMIKGYVPVPGIGFPASILRPEYKIGNSGLPELMKGYTEDLNNKDINKPFYFDSIHYEFDINKVTGIKNTKLKLGFENEGKNIVIDSRFRLLTNLKGYNNYPILLPKKYNFKGDQVNISEGNDVTERFAILEYNSNNEQVFVPKIYETDNKKSYNNAKEFLNDKQNSIIKNKVNKNNEMMLLPPKTKMTSKGNTEAILVNENGKALFPEKGRDLTTEQLKKMGFIDAVKNPNIKNDLKKQDKETNKNSEIEMPVEDKIFFTKNYAMSFNEIDLLGVEFGELKDEARLKIPKNIMLRDGKLLNENEYIFVKEYKLKENDDKKAEKTDIAVLDIKTSDGKPYDEERVTFCKKKNPFLYKNHP